METQNEIKEIAKNIAYNLGNKVCDNIKTYGYEDVYNAAIQAIETTRQQMINKANNECAEMLWKIQCALEEKGLGDCLFMEEFISGFNNFKQSMKGE